MELVNSIVKAVRILDLLKDQGTLSYIEILKQLPLPKSTLFKILGTLESEELVRRDAATGKYELGVKLIEWGSGARSQLEIRKIALPFMQKLSEDINCTIHLAVVAHGEVLPIESFESGSTTWPHYLFHGGIGIPAPLHATAAGKAILAFMKSEEMEATVKVKGLQKYTENTITSMTSLRAAFSEIRLAGYAVSYSEHYEMVRGVAAPIRDHDGKVFASLSALGITSRITPEWVPEIAMQVIAAANEISRLFGYCGTSAAS
ncbi:MAG: IclR family transcriptional regulator [Polaromonas sp.]|nr:IclR family transcriptional regulator [Polaromonas sp.]